MSVAIASPDLVDKVMQRSMKSFERNHRPLRINKRTDIKKTYCYRNYVAFTNKIVRIARAAKWSNAMIMVFVDYCTSQVVRQKLIKYGLGSLIQDAFLADCKTKFERMRQELIDTRKIIVASLQFLNSLCQPGTGRFMPLYNYLVASTGLSNVTKLYRSNKIDAITLACHKDCRKAIKAVRDRDPVQSTMLPTEDELNDSNDKAKRKLGSQLLAELFGDNLHS